jgi:hypothetical protein
MLNVMLVATQGIDCSSASCALRKMWDLCQGAPKIQKTKTLVCCFGLDSVLVTEGNFVTDLEETCLIII